MNRIIERIFGSPISTLIGLGIAIFALYNYKNIDATTITVLISATVSLCSAKDH